MESGPFSDQQFPFALGLDHVNRLAKWPAFKKRNVAAMLDADIAALDNLQVWLNTHVVAIRTDDSGVELSAVSPDGDTMTITGMRVIIAAGAIETTRLALLIDRQNGGAVSAVTHALGASFADHISTEVAEIIPADRAALNRIIGFRFGAAGSMRNIRFELAPETPARQTLPPSFSHIGFKVDKPGGFDVLREIFQNLQRRKVPPPRVIVDLIRHAPWLARAAWWRFVHKRLLFPAHSRLMVHAVIEQVPQDDNRIALSDDQTDQFGLPLAEITWQVTDDDRRNIIGSADLFRKTWESSGFARLGTWQSLNNADILASLDTC